MRQQQRKTRNYRRYGFHKTPRMRIENSGSAPVLRPEADPLVNARMETARYQNERLPLLLNTLTWVIVVMPGPTQDTAFALGDPMVFQVVTIL